VCGHPRGRLGEASIPTRSARTPLVVRSLHRRLETPALPGAARRRRHPVKSRAERCEPRLPRSHHARPTPAKGRSSRARSPRVRVTLARGRAARARIRTGCEPVRRSGPRAASPALPRRRTGSAAPEVPSIGETGHRHPDVRPHQARIRTTGGRDEPYLYPGMVLSPGCCQPVDRTRRLFQSRCIRRP